MQRRTAQRLSLHRSTLRTLASGDLDRAHGGMIYSVIITLVRGCQRPEPPGPDDTGERGGSTADGEPEPVTGLHCYRGG